MLSDSGMGETKISISRSGPLMPYEGAVAQQATLDTETCTPRMAGRCDL